MELRNERYIHSGLFIFLYERPLVVFVFTQPMPSSGIYVYSNVGWDSLRKKFDSSYELTKHNTHKGSYDQLVIT